MKLAGLFIVLLAAWLLIVWPFDPLTGAVSAQAVVAGVVVALAASLLVREVVPPSLRYWLGPVRLFWLVLYVAVLAGYVVRANLDVAYRVLHPDMPIRPGIVRIRTRLRTPAAITLLANSVTLTPGTLTVDALADGTMYVHWIFVRTEDVEEATREIVGRFEWFLERIFE